MVKVEVKANLLWILMPNYLALVLRKKPFIRPGHRNASSAYNSESTTVTRALSPSSCSFLPCNGLPVCLLIFTYLNGALTLERGFAKFVLGGAMQQFDHCYCTRYLRLILLKFWLRFFPVMDIVSMTLPQYGIKHTLNICWKKGISCVSTLTLLGKAIYQVSLRSMLRNRRTIWNPICTRIQLLSN